jgi:hypothetical protein
MLFDYTSNAAMIAPLQQMLEDAMQRRRAAGTDFVIEPDDSGDFLLDGRPVTAEELIEWLDTNQSAVTLVHPNSATTNPLVEQNNDPTVT